MTERAWQDQVLELAQILGWKVEHRLPEMASGNSPLPEEEAPSSGLGDSLVGTEVCAVTLQGEPTTKARPRFAKGRVFTDPGTAAAEEAIRWQFLAAKVKPDADHVLRVDLTFRSSTGQRRDLDNLVKLVLDAANGYVWRDDVQITVLQAQVDRRSAKPGTDLRVERVGRYTSDCRRCGKVLALGPGKTAGRAGYCSRACYDAVQKQGRMVACPECQAPVYRQRSEESKAKFCSAPCSYAHKTGSRRPTKDDQGFPSLVLVRERVVFAQLKAEDDELSSAQQATLERLRATGIEVCLWRPSDLDMVRDVLARRSP